MTCLDAADDEGRESPTVSGVDIARAAMGARGSEGANVCSQLANTTHRGGGMA